LDALAIKFIEASVEERDRQTKAKASRDKRDKRIAYGIAAGSLGALIISSGLGFMAWQKTQQAEYNQAESLGRYSLSLLNENKGLDAFVQAIKAGKILQKQRTTNAEVMEALQKALIKVRESNSFNSFGYRITSVSFSPDAKTLASGSDDGTIKLWNVETGQKIHTLDFDNFAGEEIVGISFSADSKRLISVYPHGTTKLWNVKTGQEIRTIKGYGDSVASVSFSSGSKTLAAFSYDNGIIKLWNVETGKEIRTLNGHRKSVSSVSFSPDGKTLASGSNDNTIKLWNVETGEEIHTLKGHDTSYNGVRSVNFSPDSKTLASGSPDRTVKLWNVETGKEIRTLKGDNSSVESVNFSPDGKTLASGYDDGTIKIWDVKTGKEILTLKHHKWAVISVSFSPDGKTLASGSSDSTVKLWNVEKEKEIRTLTDDHILQIVSFSPDSKTLAYSTGGGTIKLWNIKTGQAIQILNIGDRDFSFGSDGKTLASIGNDGTIKLWDLKMKKTIRSFKQPANFSRSSYSESLAYIDFTPDLKTLASIPGDGTIKLWSLGEGNKTYTIPVVNSSQLSKEGVKHPSNPIFMSFSPDSKMLASVNGYDDTMKLWNIETGKEIRTFTEHDPNIHYVSFSADGNRLVTGNNYGIIKIWNVQTGKQILTLTENNDNGDDNHFSGLVFNPDGKTLAVIRRKKKEIELWDLDKKIKFRTLVEYEDNYRSDSTMFNNIQFSPDGKILVSIDNDGTLKLWNGSNGWGLDGLMGRSCDWVRNYLTHNPNVSESDKHLCEGIATKQ